jgi:hypothetical protein
MNTILKTFDEVWETRKEGVIVYEYESELNAASGFNVDPSSKKYQN